MSRWVKALAAISDYLSLIPQTHMVEREGITHALAGVNTQHTHIHKSQLAEDH